MGKKIEVSFFEWHRLRDAVESMQGQVFYCQDEEGVLRRWYPPRVPEKEGK